MKNLTHLFFPVILVITSSISAFAQYEISIANENGTSIVSLDTTIVLTSFKGVINADKTYLKWTVKNQHADGIYMIYSSDDGINYTNIGYKQGIGVPITNDISYYFIDQKSAPETHYYKLLFVSKNSTYLLSDKLTINTDKILTASNRDDH